MIQAVAFLSQYKSLTYKKTGPTSFVLEGELQPGTRKCRIDFPNREGTAVYRSPKKAAAIIESAFKSGSVHFDFYVITPLTVDPPELIEARTAALARGRESTVEASASR